MAHVLSDYPEVELLAGVPYPKVSPKRTHSLVQSALVRILYRYGAKRGNAGTEWRFKLTGDTEFVPDVAFVSFERLRGLGDDQLEEPPFAPDIAVEVRSPSRRPKFESSKIRQYLTHGATLVLEVDPKDQTVYAHTAAGSVSVFKAGDKFAHTAAPWLSFEVDELFADLKIPR